LTEENVGERLIVDWFLVRARKPHKPTMDPTLTDSIKNIIFSDANCKERSGCQRFAYCLPESRTEENVGKPDGFHDHSSQTRNRLASFSLEATGMCPGSLDSPNYHCVVRLYYSVLVYTRDPSFTSFLLLL
ncbi:hypothetical protein AVEN_73056-1, partial [Araneus ventricosus]